MANADLTDSFIVSAAEYTHLRARSPPTTPDGLYAPEVHASLTRNGKDDTHSRLYNLLDRIQQQKKRGAPVVDMKSVEGLTNLVEAKLTGKGVDDRTDFFTRALNAIGKLPPQSQLQTTLNNEAMAILYNTLPHPPATRLGPAHQFRAADGGGNDVGNYDLGRAGTPYARSVQGRWTLPGSGLPEEGLVFDMLLKARDFKPHPGENSSLTFAFASLVTHSLFRTDLANWTINNTSSYLDLSPLYGINQAQQDSVRDTKGKNLGRGLLYGDTFAEERLGFLPAGVSALLVVFSRNHNYIAKMLLKINERGTWSDPPPTDDTKRKKQDEEIFQTARLVNCGHFMAMIFGDYVAGFLGLGRDGNAWSMNPFDPITTKTGDIIPRGQGNHVSVEFNLLYRWHATLAKEDIEWTEKLFNDRFNLRENGKTYSTLTYEDVKKAAGKVFGDQPMEPQKREFGGIKRQADGTFSDDDLASILHHATEKVAGAYRARGTPEVLRVIEVMSMQQARRWGVCTMNEFRKFLNLKPFETFEEWNPDKSVAEAARQLYFHVDNLELYPGLQAEQTVGLGPGSGICCGYTMTRAILADAIALVRGDRFYTTDFTPTNLTAWGFQDCARNPDNGAFGAALPKLLFRHLPRHYPHNSAYALFPFFIPSVTAKNLGKLEILQQYDCKNKPVALPVPKVVHTLKGARQVLQGKESFGYTKECLLDAELVGGGPGCGDAFLAAATAHGKDDHPIRSLVNRALFPDSRDRKSTMDGYAAWFARKTGEVLRRNSVVYEWGVPGRHVDVVSRVVDVVGVYWAAEQLIGIPLKTNATPRGLFTEQEVNDMLMQLFTCVFANDEPENQWTIRHTAAKIVKVVKEFVEDALVEADVRNAKNRFFGTLTNTIKGTLRLSGIVNGNGSGYGKKPNLDFLARLTAESTSASMVVSPTAGVSTKELVAAVLGVAVGSAVGVSQVIARVLEFYLSDERKSELEKIREICARLEAASKAATSADAEAEAETAREVLRGYVREAMRLCPPIEGVMRTFGDAGARSGAANGSAKGASTSTGKTTTVQARDQQDVEVKEGDMVFVNLKDAMRDPNTFPNPLSVDPTRPASSYLFSDGTGIDAEFTTYVAAEVVRVILTQPGLRREPGPRGYLGGFDVEGRHGEGTTKRMYVTTNGNVTPWPGSMWIVYDDAQKS